MSYTTTESPVVVGQPVPPFTPHAISVSLPTWKDNVAYEEGEKWLVKAMVAGYPRFFIAKNIQKLASICEGKFGVEGERCLLCPSKTVAERCRDFMINRSPIPSSPVPVRLIDFMICPEDSATPSSASCLELHIALFPEDAFPLAKQFWQHTGLGISSRMAERCLAMLPDVQSPVLQPVRAHSPVLGRTPTKPTNRHYSVKSSSTPSSAFPRIGSPPSISQMDETMSGEHTSYLEERYGRNLPLGYASATKRALRRRIAGVLMHDQCSPAHDPLQQPFAGQDDAELGPSSRGVESVSETDVFLYPTGMSAIWAAHQLALMARPVQKSVCFGFPYTDTLKILQKWGPGCHFFGHGLDSDIDELEKLLRSLSPNHTTSSLPPILALFTEFPSNPLLRSADLPRLRALADRYDFLIVVDETIGNFVNVSVLPYADVVVSSLTKVFSGDSNVMGGSLVLNPRGRHYTALKKSLRDTYEDVYFDEDAIFMERNSRHFKRRVKVINENAEAVCDFLRSRSVSFSSTSNSSGPHANRVVKEVYYPKYTSRENFDKCRNVTLPADEANFGGLFSVTFTSNEASRAFFDALACHKGPSLGTSFTLACPYTILAHYGELDWAKEYGVEEGLVRVSVGTEEQTKLLNVFVQALGAAEAVPKS